MNTEDYRIDENPGLGPEPPEQQPPERTTGQKLIYGSLVFLGMVAFAALSFFLLFYVIPESPETTLKRQTREIRNEVGTVQNPDTKKIDKEIAYLEKKVDKLTNQGPYLIVNTTDNKFYLYSGNKMIRTGPCSTGKNELLIAGKREFRFKTPRGVHKVLRKQANPVWAKPDWAFIEDGEPIPPPGDPSRFDEYTLGPYKLEIGNGYMVHGTIWKRFMGQSVTHGCIRMLDDDIEAVYKTLPVGSKVIIY
jgi:lipoprotein-anchoring transpeptidase ErfK/SrfK